MRAPDFWDQPDSLAARLLTPLSHLYAQATRSRLKRPGWKAPVPVICIGNLVAGGAGKTPVALAVMALLRARGIDAHFLSRGHGGRLAGPVRVDPAAQGAADVGDEPLLLAQAAPAWVARDRAAGARAAVAAGAQTIVMDDGFQNPGLAKDLSLIVVDGGYGFGNGLVMPAGPLREPVADGLARAQAAVLVGADRCGALAAIGARLPVLAASLEPQDGARFAGRLVLAFAGIGRPEKFFETLRALEALLVDAVAFPDHHPYGAAEIAGLVERAQAQGATPVTTRKDWVRLPAELKSGIEVLDIALAWQDRTAIDRLLAPLFPG